MARVRGVILRAASSGSRPRRTGSLSQKTGTSPHHIIGTTEAQNGLNETREDSEAGEGGAEYGVYVAEPSH